jgi:hypothetical protein
MATPTEVGLSVRKSPEKDDQTLQDVLAKHREKCDNPNCLAASQWAPRYNSRGEMFFHNGSIALRGSTALEEYLDTCAKETKPAEPQPPARKRPRRQTARMESASSSSGKKVRRSDKYGK